MKQNPKALKLAILAGFFYIVQLSSAFADTYTFTGVGTYNDPMRWTCSGTCPDGVNAVPPTPLLSGSSIIIDGTAFMNKNQRIDAGATLTVNMGGSLIITSVNTLNILGEVTNNGTINSDGTIIIRGNLINNNILINNPLGTVNGDGIITGDFNNDGTLSMEVGAIGIFTITGNYTASATAIHIIEIRQNNNGTPRYDQIIIGGVTTLNGTLKLIIDNANEIIDGDIFYPILTSSMVGTFSTLDFPGIFADWTTTYSTNSISITYSGAPLPIELVDFKGKQVGEAIHLAWETATEQDNAFVAVEKSKDGRSFVEIGQQKGAGNSLIPQFYTFIDEQPLAGLNYYRLRQVDFDGAENYHKVISIDFDGGDGKTENMTLYPTLVSDHLNIALGEAMQQNGALRIVDMAGRVILQQSIGQGVQQDQVNVSNLQNGKYFISVETGRKILMASFVKQ